MKIVKRMKGMKEDMKADMKADMKERTRPTLKSGVRPIRNAFLHDLHSLHLLHV